MRPDKEEHVDSITSDDSQPQNPQVDFIDKYLWVRFRVKYLGEIRFNPVVAGSSILLIIVFVVWCLVLKGDAPFFSWKDFILANFSWFYIGAQNVWAVFLGVLYFSKYSKLKLGKPDDKPEFNDATWFMMLFACGIGVGLFFYGVGEPIYHYTGHNRYTADKFKHDNELAQMAINITLYHWTLHSWVVYSLVGLLLALLTFRFDLPMTIRSCFYPLIGDRIFGWLGDLVDIVSILSTLFGVCTSLGLGTKQLNQGITSIFPSIPGNDITIQVSIMWIITAMATASTVSGIGFGVRRLSEICFMVGLFLMTIVFLMDNTSYILNLGVQSIGFYFYNLLQLDFHTDAFEQLGESFDATSRGRIVMGDDSYDGPPDWLANWTLFYWGWWISWSPFVGMFIAKISKGRTIREFLNGALTAPLIYSFLWIVIFGGSAIGKERMGAKFGLCCPDDSGWFHPAPEMKTLSLGRILNKTINLQDHSWLCQGKDCGPCAKSTIERFGQDNFTANDVIEAYERLGDHMSSVSKDLMHVRLSCHSIEDMWFDVMRSYGGVTGWFLAVFSLIGIGLYFITSSDSGSIVIDCLTSNGDPEPPAVQRVFWAMAEGATATALLVAGGQDSLQALQSAGLIAGLPFTAILSLMCISIWKLVKISYGEVTTEATAFSCGLLDCLGARPYKGTSDRGHHSTRKLFGLFLKNFFLAPLTLAKASLMGRKVSKWTKVNAYLWPSLAFGLSLLFWCLSVVDLNMGLAFGMFFYLSFSCMNAYGRAEMRTRLGIDGSHVEDLILSIAFYPCVLTQMEVTANDGNYHH